VRVLREHQVATVKMQGVVEGETEALEVWCSYSAFLAEFWDIRKMWWSIAAGAEGLLVRDCGGG
jgi:hypothetical protein